MKKNIFVLLALFIPILFMMLFFRHIISSSKHSVQLTKIENSEWQQLSKDPAVIHRGKIEYQLRCYKCHGNDLTGTYKGVSLVDDQWNHGSSYNDIYESIFNGKGKMKGYGKKLLDSDIKAITVFITSKQN